PGNNLDARRRPLRFLTAGSNSVRAQQQQQRDHVRNTVLATADLVDAKNVRQVPEFLSLGRFAHNRKEAKTHGDGGSLVGASLKGKRVLIIDDVITAGTPINESTAILATQPGAKLVGICIALDRQERAAADDDVPDKRSAIQKGEKNYGVKVTSVCTLENIITYLRQQGFHIFTSHHPLSPLRPKTNPQAWDTHVSSSSQ
ncbi:unnamed protein product, partial [Tilletia caries]